MRSLLYWVLLLPLGCSESAEPAADGGAGAQGSAGAQATGGSGSAQAGQPASAGSAAQSGGAPSSTAGASSGGAPSAPSNTFYISPDGNDQNAGTEDAPFFTLAKAQEQVQPGGTIWVMAGTFDYVATMILSKSGTEAEPIKIWAVPGARPVFDFSQQPRGESALRGVEVRTDWWHIKGLEIQNASDNGMAISGSHNIVEDVIFHGNGDTGLQITVSEGSALIDTLGAYNQILNCDSYENWDGPTNGENADGFAAKLRIGAGNLFRGCRAWRNADDGWDLFAADDVVTIEDCWAFSNGKTSQGPNPAGDGNGFKLGGAPDGPGQGGAPHLVTRSAAFENRTCGFNRNNNPDEPEMSECAVADNPDGDYCDGALCSSEIEISMSSDDAIAMPRNDDGSLPAIQ